MSKSAPTILFIVLLLVGGFLCFRIVVNILTFSNQTLYSSTYDTRCQRNIYLPYTSNLYVDYYLDEWESEPNNSYLEADGPLKPETEYYGRPNDVKDYFSFYLLHPAEIEITLRNHVGTGVQVQLYYENTNGDPVADDRGSPGKVEYVTEDLGWYYIYISADLGDDTETKYTLKLELTPSAPTSTPTPTYTFTPAPVDGTPTPTLGPCIPTPTNTPTSTPTNTPTSTPTNTPTSTPTNTPMYTPTPTPFIIFETHSNLGDEVGISGSGNTYNTGMSVSDYECGIIGMLAGNGRIQANIEGEIIQLELYPDSGTWWIRADFWTEGAIGENWTIQTICIDNDYSHVYRQEAFSNQADGVEINTTVDANRYVCAVVGMSTTSADINQSGIVSSLFDVLIYPEGTWRIRPDIATHNSKNEKWNIDLFCFDLEDFAPESILYNPETFYNQPHSVDEATTVNKADYVCGIASARARDGRFDSTGEGNIIYTYMYLKEESDVWWIKADLLNLNASETWDINFFCISRTIATIKE